MSLYLKFSINNNVLFQKTFKFETLLYNKEKARVVFYELWF